MSQNEQRGDIGFGEPVADRLRIRIHGLVHS